MVVMYFFILIFLTTLEFSAYIMKLISIWFQVYNYLSILHFKKKKKKKEKKPNCGDQFLFCKEEEEPNYEGYFYLFIYFAQIEERHSLKEKTQYKEM